MGKLDDAMGLIDDVLLKEAAENEKMNPLLDRQLKRIQLIDNKIKYFEEIKQKELRTMSDLLELAHTNTHVLKDGFKVMPDNRYNITITDIGAFMRWLKLNKNADDIFDFFKSSLKVAEIKKFCSQEFNIQQNNGEIKPTIDGISVGEMQFRKLKTLTEKG